MRIRGDIVLIYNAKWDSIYTIYCGSAHNVGVFQLMLRHKKFVKYYVACFQPFLYLSIWAYLSLECWLKSTINCRDGGVKLPPFFIEKWEWHTYTWPYGIGSLDFLISKKWEEEELHLWILTRCNKLSQSCSSLHSTFQ